MPSYKVVVYTPVSHSHTVKQAAFGAGAGVIGKYTHVAFETLGLSEFVPSEGSTPAIGTPGMREVVDERKLEITVGESADVKEVVRAIKKAHPYEEVVCDVYRLEDLGL